MGLNRNEINILKLINKSGQTTKSNVIRFLTKDVALPSSMAMDFYTLWFLNRREDGRYEEIKDPNKDLQPFINILKRVLSGDMDGGDLPEKFFGDEIEECYARGYGYHRSWNLPCVEVDNGMVYFKFDRDTWELPNICGLMEEDLWKYYDSQPSYYSDYNEEHDKDEFNYLNYNDETLDLIKKIAVGAKRDDVIDYIDNTESLQTEQIAEFLEDMLPDDKFDNLRDEYIWEIDRITTDIRRKNTSDYYDEEIVYNVSMGGEYFEMEIPLDEFIELIEDSNPFSFSDIKDEEIELNPQIDLESAWYNTGYWDSSETSHIEELNSNLQKIVDDLGEGGLVGYYENQRLFKNILDNTNLEFKRKDWRGIKTYETPDGRLKLHSGDIDFDTEKITFTYDDVKHTVPFQNFINWAQGSVLDLKYESVRYGKIPLREGKKTITKISIFDFDGTLADTPSKEDGIPIWEAKTKKEYPHLGWYSKRESLDEKVFNIKLIPSTVRDYTGESINENTLVVMLTGRMPNQADQVEKLLSKNGVVFEEYHYKERGDTFSSKINTIKKLISQNPNVTEVEMWEDRLNHADGFEQWGQQNGVNIKVNRVTI